MPLFFTRSHVEGRRHRDGVRRGAQVTATRLFGQRLPAHATALGKCLLSECSEAELAVLYPTSTLEQFTERTIGSREELVAAVREARNAGGAEDWEEITAGLCCAAAPVRDASGRIVVAVSFSMPAVRADTATWRLLRSAIRDAAAEISQRVGFQC